MKRATLAEISGEVVGTFILVFFGTGSVAAAVLTGAQQGLWQVAVVWGFGITLAIYTTGALSGAHLNPAVSIAFAAFRSRGFPARKLVHYIPAQLCGAVLGSLLVYALFAGPCVRFEEKNGIERGKPGSQLSAMWFGEYYPNPAVFGTTERDLETVPTLGGFLGEAVGTFFLLMFIFAVVDRRNPGAPGGRSNLAAYFIGFTVAIVISIVAPLTQAGLNPARDFGPRLVAWAAGWGDIAIPGPRGGFWVYILGPIVGGLTGALAYDQLIRRFHLADAGAVSPAPEAEA